MNHMAKDVISVVIPNLNGAHYLSPCLSSVFAQELLHTELEVIVVDNGSSDESVEIVRARFPQTKILRNEANVGFTRAINQGIEAAHGHWLLLLNNDTVMGEKALATLLAALKSGEVDLAGAQPLMVCAKDSGILDSAGISLTPHFRAQDALQGHPLAEAPTEMMEIWGTCFGCALLKRCVFEQCGYLDADFFAEWDDVEFSLRARWHGWRFLLVPAARVFHHRSPTSLQKPDAKFVRRRRNQILTYAKGLPFFMAISLTLYRFQRDFFMAAHFIRHGQFGSMLRSWREYFALLPRMIVRRRQLRATATMSSREIRRQLHRFMVEGTRRIELGMQEPRISA
jgi:GT2 family glycosyltransferase